MHKKSRVKPASIISGLTLRSPSRLFHRSTSSARAASLAGPASTGMNRSRLRPSEDRSMIGSALFYICRRPIFRRAPIGAIGEYFIPSLPAMHVHDGSDPTRLGACVLLTHRGPAIPASRTLTWRPAFDPLPSFYAIRRHSAFNQLPRSNFAGPDKAWQICGDGFHTKRRVGYWGGCGF